MILSLIYYAPTHRRGQ